MKYPLRGVEIGCDRGFFSANLLYAVPGLQYAMVDLWGVYPEHHPYHKTRDVRARRSQQRWDNVFREAVKRTNAAGGKNRTLFIRKESKHAVELFDDGHFDFIFIDGDHSYDGCLMDIELWLPKLAKGGIFGGHDWLNPTASGNKVKEAVEKQALWRGKRIELDVGYTWWFK